MIKTGIRQFSIKYQTKGRKSTYNKKSNIIATFGDSMFFLDK